MSQDKKNKRQQQNRPHNQKAAGLVNANHFYETADELANRHLEQHQLQQQSQGQRQKRQKGQQNPENPGQQ